MAFPNNRITTPVPPLYLPDLTIDNFLFFRTKKDLNLIFSTEIMLRKELSGIATGEFKNCAEHWKIIR